MACKQHQWISLKIRQTFDYVKYFSLFLKKKTIENNSRKKKKFIDPHSRIFLSDLFSCASKTRAPRRVYFNFSLTVFRFFDSPEEVLGFSEVGQWVSD